MEEDMMERVHFYSAGDLSMGGYLDRLEAVLDAYVPGRMMEDINDVMELWHCRYFVESRQFRRWDAERYSRYKKVVRDCVGDIVLFFNRQDEDAFFCAFDTLDYDYRRTLFEVFDSVARNSLTESILRKILSQKPCLIREVLHGKNTVRKWAVLITEFLKAYPSTAELLLDQFVRNVYATFDPSCAIHGVCQLLFSEQSPLANVKYHEKKVYKSLFETMCCERVDYGSLHDNQRYAVDFLVEHDILMLDEEEMLSFSDMSRLTVYLYLWKYQVVSYWQCAKEMREEMNRLLEKGWLESDSFLLGRQEQEWFSFCLNNAIFTNGPAIRNVFEHGANAGYTEEQMQMMYYQVLMLFITLLYKIDLDLRLGIAVSKAMSSR